MCEAFAANDVEVTLLHPYRQQHDPVLQEKSVFEYYGIRSIFKVRTLSNWDVVRLESFALKSMFRPLFFTHALVWGFYATLVARKEGADLYYTRNSEVAYWLVKLGLPTVYEAHVVPKQGQRLLLQQIARHPALQLVVALTSFIKERFVSLGFPRGKIIVLPDGVDLRLFENLPSKEECRRQLEFPLDRPIIGYIGRFRTMEMEKGIPELIQAVALLPELNEGEPLLLCVGGPMDAVPAYLELLCKLGVPEERVKFVDRVPNSEIPYWIRTFDIAAAAFPNTEHYAYFMSPLKLFEYMAAGVPIIATDLPSIREVLRHGENAWLVQPESPEALAEGICVVMENPGVARRLAEHAREEAEKYTWEKRAASILTFLEGIIK
jgi:glycosyltransferase involved in cell wall biosynthesis